MDNKTEKLLFGVWTAACLGFVTFAFFAAPAWNTGESYILPNGASMFVFALLSTFFVWVIGIGLLWLLLVVAEEVVDAVRSRRANSIHRVHRARRVSALNASRRHRHWR